MEEKKIILITAFTSTKKQVEELNLTIDSYKETGVEIMLSSHSVLPKKIQKKLDYFIYDKKNPISDDLNLISYLNFNTPNWEINSKFFQKNFYGFAIMRLLSNALKVLQNLNYEKVIAVEYDCKLLDKNLINFIFENLNLHNYIFVNQNGDENENIIGNLMAFNLSEVSENYLNYNEKYIYEKLVNTKTKSLEEFSKITIPKNKNILFLPLKDVENKIQTGKKFISRLNNFTIFHENGIAKILYYNFFDENLNIDILINNSFLVNFECFRNQYHIKDLCEIHNLEKIKIFLNNQLTYQEFFDEKKRENIINYSIIKYK